MLQKVQSYRAAGNLLAHPSRTIGLIVYHSDGKVLARGKREPFTIRHLVRQGLEPSDAVVEAQSLLGLSLKNLCFKEEKSLVPGGSSVVYVYTAQIDPSQYSEHGHRIDGITLNWFRAS